MTTRENALADIESQDTAFRVLFPDTHEYHLAGYILGIHHCGNISFDHVRALEKKYEVEVFGE